MSNIKEKNSNIASTEFPSFEKYDKYIKVLGGNFLVSESLIQTTSIKLNTPLHRDSNSLGNIKSIIHISSGYNYTISVKNYNKGSASAIIIAIPQNLDINNYISANLAFHMIKTFNIKGKPAPDLFYKEKQR